MQNNICRTLQLVEKLCFPVIMSYPRKRVSSNILKRLDSRFHGNDGKSLKPYLKEFFNSLFNLYPVFKSPSQDLTPVKGFLTGFHSPSYFSFEAESLCLSVAE